MVIVLLAVSAAVHVQDSTPSRTPRRPPVTPAALASAFRDAAARDLFTRVRRTRLAQDSALASAGGDSVYGRGALDVTVSRELWKRVAAVLTVAGGSSIGALPMQRRWFLGGTPTIRGQSPDTAQSGNAFWMSRTELARQNEGYRASLFGDIGWAGDRTRASEVGRPLSGVGVGISAFDGMIRLDVARGLYPREQTRMNLYLDARF